MEEKKENIIIENSKTNEKESKKSIKKNEKNDENSNKIKLEQKKQEEKKISAQQQQNQFVLKSSTFVIQKYVEKPMLIYNRKFDIRVWALVDQNLEVYLFKYEDKLFNFFKCFILIFYIKFNDIYFFN